MNTKPSTITLLILAAMLAACSLPTTAGTSTATAALPPIPSDTPAPSPTATEVVMYVASVNGNGIRQSSFDASMLQFDAALQDYPDLVPEGKTAQDVVMDSLIDRALLAQAARQSGYVADDQMVANRLAQLVEQAGGQDAFETWLSDNGYTLKTFLPELALEMEAAYYRDQIAASIPDTMDQVRAQQIFFVDGYQAMRAYNQLQAGIAFDTILQNNSPNDPGYMDWFPRGYLVYPELEDAIFSLQPGQYTQVLESPAGYHIIYVIERDPNHPLSSQVRLFLQQKAVRQWLDTQRAQSQVDIFLP